MADFPAGYEAAAQELRRRILALIPANPRILDDDFDAWGLFDVDGFECDDLGPTLAQAQAALGAARADYREGGGAGGLSA